VSTDPDESFLPLLGRNPQAFFSPQATYPFVVDAVAVVAEIGGSSSPSPPGSFPGERAEVSTDLLIINWWCWGWEPLG